MTTLGSLERIHQAKGALSPRKELELIERSLLRDMGTCIHKHNLIASGDKIMVCMSGGKDSYTMLALLSELQKKALVPFELVAVHLDQGHPGYDGSPLVQWFEEGKHPYKILHENTYKIVKEKIPEGQTTCSLCSRLRRGILYTAAQELGCNKIALGHHRDDSIETLLMNLMFTGSIKAMPAKLLSDDKKNVVIRPMLYCKEDEIAVYAQKKAFPILPCNLCGSQENLVRKKIKQLLTDLQGDHPEVKDSIFSSLKNIRVSHLLDTKLFDDTKLEASQDPWLDQASEPPFTTKTFKDSRSKLPVMPST